jgi:hypothetical protein
VRGGGGRGGVDSTLQDKNLPQTPQTSNFTNAAPPKLDQNAFDTQIINEFTESDNVTVTQINDNSNTENTVFVTSAAVENTSDTTTTADFAEIEDENDENYDKMKSYLNSIKQAIVINGDSFIFKDKHYKIGNTINSYLIQDISTYSIQFKNNEWQYTLRFYGGEK